MNYLFILAKKSLKKGGKIGERKKSERKWKIEIKICLSDWIQSVLGRNKR